MGGDGKPKLVTQAEYDAWIPISEALDRVKAAIGGEAQAYILKRLAAGKIRAAAEDCQVGNGPLLGLVTIGTPTWRALEAIGGHWSHQFWKTDDAEVNIHDPDDRHERPTKHKFFAVRIDPADIVNLPAKRTGADKPGTPTITGVRAQPGDITAARMQGALPLTPAPVSIPAKHPGGAPAKEIWERVWVEIAARLYDGRLQPQKQKDIELAIIEITADLRDEASEATARKHAKPLWDKVKPEGS